MTVVVIVTGKSLFSYFLNLFGVVLIFPCTTVERVEVPETLTFSSGCKRVAQKIDLVVEELEEQEEAGREGLKEEL